MHSAISCGVLWALSDDDDLRRLELALPSIVMRQLCERLHPCWLGVDGVTKYHTRFSVDQNNEQNVPKKITVFTRIVKESTRKDRILDAEQHVYSKNVRAYVINTCDVRAYNHTLLALLSTCIYSSPIPVCQYVTRSEPKCHNFQTEPYVTIS